ncbi:PH domain-containing protein [Stenotrophomonas rhizophila]|uniref:PH domain-containing protein n=1 Tax=Stenotrophomonas rhizophila TaxID=216778 RepID=UPI00224A736B|nr:PH domain-containing protein [Stenotrophomonas rhizophila]MCX2918922.1 PH domain-containing protein [Stenotrophomonas rhizophila]
MSIPPPLDAAPEQRLHPWSWLFVLLMQLRQGLVPLIALVVFGQRGDRDEFWLSIGPVIAVVALVAYSVLQYLTYRYRIGATAITVRSGVFARNRREIPFARIHNVVVHQNPLHRLFGVAELKLESAGGNRPEAEMRVLKLDQALALERLVRQRGQAAPAAAAGEAALAEPAEDVLLALSPGEVIRIGLLSNRGWVVVVAVLGAMLQLFPRGSVSDVIEAGGRQAFGYASHLHPGMWLWAIAAVLAVAGFWVLLRVLSVVLALLRYYGFRLSEHERRLTVASGLLTRMRTSVARRRIQAWTLRETALQRWFQRRQLRIDIAAGNPGEGERRDLRELAPLATPAVCDGLVQHLLPHLQWPPARWQPVQRRGWWRLCLGALCVVPLLTAGAIWYGGPWGALLLLWLPWSAFRAHRQMARIGYHLDDDYVAVRGGWWQRWWRFAELDKLQALRLTRSPLDRRLGTASVWLDTAGAGMGTPLVLQYLPEAEARAVYEQLGRALARRRLRW